MRIIDAHCHLGDDVVYDAHSDEETLLTVYERNGVDGALVQPFIPRPYMEDVQAIHNRVAALCGRFPKRFYGMLFMNPHMRPQDVEKELKRCVVEQGFRGVKLHPTAYGAPPYGKDAMALFELCRAYHVPVLVHTGGGDFGNPVHLMTPIAAFPDLPIVIAHGGAEDGKAMAMELALRYEQVYLEPSWINVLGIGAMRKKLGATKLMYSSDMPENVGLALALFREVYGDSTEDLARVLGGNCIEVFGLDRG